MTEREGVVGVRGRRASDNGGGKEGGANDLCIGRERERVTRTKVEVVNTRGRTVWHARVDVCVTR